MSKTETKSEEKFFEAVPPEASNKSISNQGYVIAIECLP